MVTELCSSMRIAVCIARPYDSTLRSLLLEERGEKGYVIQDIRTSKAVGEYLLPMGGKMHTWRVGRAFAAPKLREINGIYGGELAGHYYFRDFFYSDSGLLACILIMNVIKKFKQQGVTFSQAIAKIDLCQFGRNKFQNRQEKRGYGCCKKPFHQTRNANSYNGF